MKKTFYTASFIALFTLTSIAQAQQEPVRREPRPVRTQTSPTDASQETSQPAIDAATQQPVKRQPTPARSPSPVRPTQPVSDAPQQQPPAEKRVISRNPASVQPAPPAVEAAPADLPPQQPQPRKVNRRTGNNGKNGPASKQSQPAGDNAKVQSGDMKGQSAPAEKQ